MSPKNILSKSNRKILLGLFTFVCAIGIIAMCSFFPFIVDPTRWQTEEFLSDELIIVAIVIFSIVCMMSISQASNAMNPMSKLAKARVKFLGTTANGVHVEGSVERITKHDKISAFSQWVKKVLQPRDIQSAKERILIKAGIDDFTVLKLSEAELKALMSKPQKYGDRFYDIITKKQYLDIKKAKNLKFTLVDPTYYLVCSSISSDKTITEKSGKESIKKGTLLTWSIASKSILTVIIAMIFASLVYDTTKGDLGATAWMDFASRMFSMATSSFMGYMVGCQMNDIDADFIDTKCLAHDEFFEDKTFKPLSQQELAKEAFANRVKEETALLLNHNKDDEAKNC